MTQRSIGRRERPSRDRDRYRPSTSVLAPVLTPFVLLALTIATSACGAPASPPRRPPAPIAPRRAIQGPQATSSEQPLLVICVTGLRRDGVYAVKLGLDLVNVGTGPDAVAVAPAFSFDGADAGTLADVYLLDEVRGRKYYVLRDDQGRPRSTTDLGAIPPGAVRPAWALFPAPPDDTTELTVVAPRVPPIAHVPVTK